MAPPESKEVQPTKQNMSRNIEFVNHETFRNQ